MKEVTPQLSGERDIDPNRLRQAVIEDLLQENLLGWLEANSTVSEKVPKGDKPSATDALAAPIDCIH